MDKQKIGFFKLGSFSHTNKQVEKMLRDNFQEYEVEVIDIWEDLLDIRDPLLWLSCAKEYLLDTILRKRSFIDSVYRTSYFFKKVKEKSALLIKKKQYVFTFQTQSFFDVSCEEIAHYIYTDHTHLANLYYPAFDASKLYPNKWIELEKQIYHNSTLNFTMSNHVSRSINEHYQCPENKIVTVYIGSNADNSNKSVKILDDSRYSSKNILFIGVVWERKGGPILAEAFKKVLSVIPDARLTIVGCSPKLNIANCDVVGRVALEEIPYYYQNAALFCLPTQLEPFGIVFIEALTKKLPVVASNIGAIPDFITNGVNGYLVAPDDANAFADKMIDLLQSPDKCKKFGEARYDLIFSRYSWEETGMSIRDNILRTQKKIQVT